MTDRPDWSRMQSDVKAERRRDGSLSSRDWRRRRTGSVGFAADKIVVDMVRGYVG